jgi:excisionase family DNA binding protein
MNEREILTADEVAEFLGVSPDVVTRLVDRRMIPCFRVEGLVRFRRATLLDWVSALERAEGGGPDRAGVTPLSSTAGDTGGPLPRDTIDLSGDTEAAAEAAARLRDALPTLYLHPPGAWAPPDPDPTQPLSSEPAQRGLEPRRS